MNLNANELIKLLLTKKQITQSELAVLLGGKIGKIYSQPSLSRKLTKGTITYNEVMTILDILGYEIEIKEKQ